LKSITGYNEAQTAARRVATRNGSRQTGIDAEAHNFDPIRAAEGNGKRKIGILTNQTGTICRDAGPLMPPAQAPGILMRFSAPSTVLPAL
jgi:hypothetical protein